jgi:hypothetical protein
VAHTRLSIYTKLISYATSGSAIRQTCCNGALSSALNVMRSAVNGEKQLRSLPNNLAIMICFAVCIAVRLGVATGKRSLARSVLGLAQDAADMLARAGTTPAHRNITPVLFAEHLHQTITAAAAFGRPTTSSQRPVSRQHVSQSADTAALPGDTELHASPSDIRPAPQTAFNMPDGESFAFSEMSHDQVVQTISEFEMNLQELWNSVDWNTGDFI